MRTDYCPKCKYAKSTVVDGVLTCASCGVKIPSRANPITCPWLGGKGCPVSWTETAYCLCCMLSELLITPQVQKTEDWPIYTVKRGPGRPARKE